MTLKLTGWSEAAVRAFGHVVQDDPDKAREIVKTMSGTDRAVLIFHMEELTRLVNEEEAVRHQADRLRARGGRTVFEVAEDEVRTGTVTVRSKSVEAGELDPDTSRTYVVQADPYEGPPEPKLGHWA